MTKYHESIAINIWGYIWMINSGMVGKLRYSKLHYPVFEGCRIDCLYKLKAAKNIYYSCVNVKNIVHVFGEENYN